MKALIIVDVQQDFCKGGALAVPRGEEVVPVINRISGSFPLLAATRDWHPPGHVSFASTHGKSPGDTVELAEGPQHLWPDHCVQGTAGAAFHPQLDTLGLSLILNKGLSPGLDSYSAFMENDHQTSTGLTGWLKDRGVDSVYLCGLAADYCVYFSAMDALAGGFKTYVIRDAVRGVDIPPGNLEKAFAAMEKAGVQFIESNRR